VRDLVRVGIADTRHDVGIGEGALYKAATRHNHGEDDLDSVRRTLGSHT